MTEVKKSQNKRTWKVMTQKEKEEIVRLYNTGKYTQEQIADITHRGAGTISTLIREAKGLPKKKLVLDAEPTVKKGDIKKQGENREGSYMAKKYKLSENERNLHLDVIEILQTSKSHDEFVQGYYKKFGFNSGAGIHKLIGMWTHRVSILNFEKEKKEKFEKEKKFKEHLLAVTLAQKKIFEKPIKKEKPDSLPDVGEQLVKINNNIVEMIFITKDLLQVQQDTFALFKGKIGQVKNNDVGVGDPTNRVDK